MNTNIFVVPVPQIVANDDKALLVEWSVKEESFVKPGDTICLLETAKSLFDLEAMVEGYIVHLAGEGITVTTGQAIGLIGPDINELIEAKKSYICRDTSVNEHITIKATKKAFKLAQDYGVELGSISVNGIIKEEDVKKIILQNRLNKNEIPADICFHHPLKEEKGYVSQEFLSNIIKDPAFKNLTSDFKIFLYRSYGAYIGKNVRIGSGSIILSKVICLDDDSEIGNDVSIMTERFILGKMSVIGGKANIKTREVIIGDMFFSGDSILIGGGGALGPRSSLHVGNNCLVSSYCILNTGEPIIIKNEVALSPYVQLYTHNHWQNVLNGYMARHASIIIEDGAYITGNSLVVPGIHIGKGSTVLANSVVSSDIDEYTVVSGVPAIPVMKINTNLTEAKKEYIIKDIINEMKCTLEFYRFDSDRVTYLPLCDFKEPIEADIILTFEVINLPENLEKPVVFDLTSYSVYGKETELSDEVRNFLRRRGIRFKPIYWRYTRDKGGELFLF